MGTEDLMESLVLAKWQVSENTAAGCDPRHSKQMSQLHQVVFHGQKCWHGKKPRDVGSGRYGRYGKGECWQRKAMLTKLDKGKQD